MIPDIIRDDGYYVPLMDASCLYPQGYLGCAKACEHVTFCLENFE